MSSAFISHTSDDKPFVRRLARDLRACGCDVWFDDWEIRVGDSIVQKIEEGLIDSQFLVVVLSANSVQSKWVKVELHSGLFSQISSREIKVLPALIEDCTMPVFLRHIRYADFRESYGKGFVELRDSLGVRGSSRLTPTLAEALMSVANGEDGIEEWTGSPYQSMFDPWKQLFEDELVTKEWIKGWRTDGCGSNLFRFRITSEGLTALEFREHHPAARDE